MVIEDAVFVYRLSGGNRLSWHGRYHAHAANEYEIHFFLEGSGSFQCNRTRYPIVPGRLFLTGPREFHSIVPENETSHLTWYAVLFSVDSGTNPQDNQLTDALSSCLSARQTVLSINGNFRFQFEDLHQMARSADQSLRDSAQYLLVSLLYRWFGRYGTQSDGTGKNGSSDHASKSSPGNRTHVEKALSLMQKSVRENSKIEDIAWKLGLSEEHFIRIFRQEVRMTPHQYYTRLKVEGASGLLISTDRSVGDISAWFGFENQFHFSRIFKKCTGMSPLEYRRTYLQIADFT